MALKSAGSLTVQLSHTFATCQLSFIHNDYTIATADLFLLQACAAARITSETPNVHGGRPISSTCSKGTVCASLYTIKDEYNSLVTSYFIPHENFHLIQNYTAFRTIHTFTRILHLVLMLQKDELDHLASFNLCTIRNLAIYQSVCFATHVHLRIHAL